MKLTTSEDKPQAASSGSPIRVLLLDDRADNLLLRAAILRKHGYEAITSSSIEEAEARLNDIDIAVLDYHLGAGKFGTEVANSLREKRPEVPIIILSATLERRFGGVEDMHLLKGYSSVDDLLAALRSWTRPYRSTAAPEIAHAPAAPPADFPAIPRECSPRPSRHQHATAHVTNPATDEVLARADADGSRGWHASRASEPSMLRRPPTSIFSVGCRFW